MQFENSPVATVNTSYNQDIHVSDDTLAAYPEIALLLAFRPLRECFDRADAEASRNKRHFVLFGRVSLCCALLALTGSAVDLIIRGYDAEAVPINLSVVFGALAATSLMVLLFMHLHRLRDHWLEACYKRERIRHWRWQVFLDGPLVEEAVAAQDAESLQKTQFYKQWARFQADLDSANTSSHLFKRRRPALQELFFSRRDYSDDVIAESVLSLLKGLRFQHQINYPKRATGLIAGDNRLNLKEHREWVDSFSRVSLVLALLLAVGHVVTTLVSLAAESGPSLMSDGTHQLFGVLALWAALMSGLARAYLAGLTLPEETESYEDYAARIETLYEIFALARDNASRQRIHRDLELEAERELRRFLVMKSKASFVA